MKRIVLLLILAAGAALFLAGCTGAEQPPSPPEPPPEEQPPAARPQITEMTLLWLPEEALDPFSGRSRANETLLPLLYEGLFELDEGFAPQNVLCAGYTVSEDGLTYSFSLRRAAFSDGTALSAADVVYSLKRAMEPGSNYEARLAGVSSVAAQDENTVVVTLHTPNSRLPSLLDVPVVCAAASPDGAPPPGTGPFLPVLSPESAFLVARDDWWQNKTLPVSLIRLYTAENTDAQLAAFQRGTISLVRADLTAANAVGYTGDYEIRNSLTGVMVYLGCNTAAPSLLSDPALRAALARGVDRALIAAHIYDGHGHAAALPVPPGYAGYDAALAEALSFSREALRAALAEAGWNETGEGGVLQSGTGRRAVSLELRLVVCADSSYKVAAAEHIARSLAEDGVLVTVEKLFYDEYLGALESGAFDLYLGETALTADFSPAALVASGGALNYGGWQDERMDALLLEAGLDARRYAEVYALLAGQSPIIPILFKDVSVLTQRDLITGAAPTCRNAFYGMESWTMGYSE